MLKDIKINYNSRANTISFTSQNGPLNDQNTDEVSAYVWWRFRKPSKSETFNEDKSSISVKM